ncbi:MAG TPA: murein transglycosylase [Acetobacteraceae bacterium]
MTDRITLLRIAAFILAWLAASGCGQSVAAGGYGEPHLGPAFSRPGAPLVSLFSVPARPAAVPAPAPPAIAAGPNLPAPGEACRAAIAAAERRWGIPAGLLFAMSLVESGRTDPVTGVRLPWPWTTNAEGQGYRFNSLAEAAAWVRQQQARGTASIDTGCMQVNLMHHPTAFATVELAFDPARNADYAGSFLRRLFDNEAGGDWMRAAGFYHSQTPERAERYRRLVETAMNGAGPPGQRVQLAATAAPRALPPMPGAATGGGGQMLSNNAAQAQIMPQAPGQIGRSLAAYRAAPILVAGRVLPQLPLLR